MQKLTWISFEAGPLPNMQDVQFVSDVNANIRLPQALRVTLNQYGVKVAALVLKVWRLLLQHPSIKEMQLRAQNRMKTFEDLYDLVIDSIIEDDVRELQDVPGIAPHEDLLRIQQGRLRLLSASLCRLSLTPPAPMPPLPGLFLPLPPFPLHLINPDRGPAKLACELILLPALILRF